MTEIFIYLFILPIVATFVSLLSFHEYINAPISMKFVMERLRFLRKDKLLFITITDIHAGGDMAKS